VPSADQVWEHLQANVKGEAVPVTDDSIAAANDLSRIRKYYKLNGLSWLDCIKDEKLKRKEMETLIVGSMALRGV
jgi:EKC/KEOPS complex subunit CGI121/TPRKB